MRFFFDVFSRSQVQIVGFPRSAGADGGLAEYRT